MKTDLNRYLEDFSVGQVITHLAGKTITESDNNLFCLLTMNHHPVHLNTEYARKQQHGKILTGSPDDQPGTVLCTDQFKEDDPQQDCSASGNQ